MLQATLYTTVQPELARSIIKIAYLDIANFKPKNEVYRPFSLSLYQQEFAVVGNLLHSACW